VSDRARCTLELGGKSAAIIADDFDIRCCGADADRHHHDDEGQVCANAQPGARTKDPATPELAEAIAG